jgi:hypothetical protein
VGPDGKPTKANKKKRKRNKKKKKVGDGIPGDGLESYRAMKDEIVLPTTPLKYKLGASL